MKNLLKRCCSIAFLTFFVINMALSAQSDGADKDKFRLISNDTIIKFNRYLATEKFNYQLDPEAVLPVSRRFDSRLKENLVILGEDNSSVIDLSIVERTNQVVAFYNSFASKKIYGKNSPLYDKPTQPGWSRQKTVNLAEKFVRIFLDTFPKDFELAKASYSHPHMEYPKYSIGQWFVAWVKIDKGGRKNTDDTVVVLMCEQYGPIGIGINFLLDNDKAVLYK